MTVTISNGFFKRMELQITQLEEEVLSLKHDWLMVDEVCDLKEEKIRTLTRLATNVVKGKQPLRDLKKYLDNQIVTKRRTDMSNEEKTIKNIRRII